MRFDWVIECQALCVCIIHRVIVSTWVYIIPKWWWLCVLCAHLLKWKKSTLHKKWSQDDCDEEKKANEQRVGFCYQSARSIVFIRLLSTYTGMLTTHSFPYTISFLQTVPRLRRTYRFVILQHRDLVCFDRSRLKVSFAFYSNWMKFVLYSLFLLQRYLQCFALTRRLLVFFLLLLGFSLFSFYSSLNHTDYHAGRWQMKLKYISTQASSPFQRYMMMMIVQWLQEFI